MEPDWLLTWQMNVLLFVGNGESSRKSKLQKTCQYGLDLKGIEIIFTITLL